MMYKQLVCDLVSSRDGRLQDTDNLRRTETLEDGSVKVLDP